MAEKGFELLVMTRRSLEEISSVFLHFPDANLEISSIFMHVYPLFLVSESFVVIFVELYNRERDIRFCPKNR